MYAKYYAYAPYVKALVQALQIKSGSRVRYCVEGATKAPNEE